MAKETDFHSMGLLVSGVWAGSEVARKDRNRIASVLDKSLGVGDE